MPKILRIEQLRFLYLGPIDLTLSAGECVCISGASGSGKSLLLRTIVDLLPHDGEVYWNGHRCSQIKPPQWRRWLGLLPAESQWWYEQVGAHFSQAVPEDWLGQLGFAPEVMHWSVSRCSTGEKQRLALLRLLVNRPKALLLDEPTASLDEQSTQDVEQLIKTYQQQHQAPVVWVSHNPRQIERVAQRHFVFRRGMLQQDKV